MLTACSACGSTTRAPLETWKHIFWQCQHCGTIEREARTHLRRARFLRAGLGVAKQVLPGKARVAERLLTTAFSEPMSERAGVHAYFYGAPYEQSAWKQQDDALLELLSALGVSIEGKRVLTISDGPGFLAQRLARTVSSIVTTEISRVAVELMHETLGIDARQYDFDLDLDLVSVAPGPFDCVLLRSCLEFARDLDSLTHDLRAVVAPGGVVYAVFRAPSRRECLRVMFEDFAPKRWSPPEVVERAFQRAGFDSVDRQRALLEGHRESRLMTAARQYYNAKASLKRTAFTEQTEFVQYTCLFKR